MAHPMDGLQAVDCMISFPASDFTHYDFIRDQLKDDESTDFEFPVEYMFKGVPKELYGSDDPIALLIEGREVEMAERVPEGTPRCSLQLGSPKALDSLRTADVQELLDAMLDGSCRLSGQVEPFVWLIGRLAEWQPSVAG